MIVVCDVCHETAFYVQGATFAPDHRVVCEHCLASVYESGKDGEATYKAGAGTLPVAVPANVAGRRTTTSDTPTSPTSSGDDSLRTPTTSYNDAGNVRLANERTSREKLYFGCPGLGEPGDEFYIAGHSAVWQQTERGPWPRALCSRCYDVVQSIKKAVGRR